MEQYFLIDSLERVEDLLNLKKCVEHRGVHVSRWLAYKLDELVDKMSTKLSLILLRECSDSL